MVRLSVTRVQVLMETQSEPIAGTLQDTDRKSERQTGSQRDRQEVKETDRKLEAEKQKFGFIQCRLSHRSPPPLLRYLVLMMSYGARCGAGDRWPALAC